MDKSAYSHLAGVRYNKAVECLEDAESIFINKKYRASNDRSYHAIFHFIRAANALDDFDSKKHTEVISHFNQRFVYTGIFESKVSKIINDSLEIRNSSEWDDFDTVSIQEAQQQLSYAKYIHKVIKNYLISENVLQEDNINSTAVG